MRLVLRRKGIIRRRGKNGGPMMLHVIVLYIHDKG